MNAHRVVRRARQALGSFVYRVLDHAYLPFDRHRVRRTKNIHLIPGIDHRFGGKRSYAEWAHVIGIFQTLMFLHLPKNENNAILDVGCGTGLLAIASEPFLQPAGTYTGLDVRKEDILFDRSHYPPGRFRFEHLDASNNFYAPDRDTVRARWRLEDASFDAALALSLWTHLSETDALFYFRELGRVLKPGGRAIVTFFLLDRTYRQGLECRSRRQGRFHMTRQDEWIFELPAYGSAAWFHPKWATLPEKAIGITEEGLDRLTTTSGLRLVRLYPGNWKEIPGPFFQDVLVFERCPAAEGSR